MKRILAVLILMIVILSLASCAKCVRTEISEVEVEFVEAYYKASSTYFVPTRVGKVTTMSPRVRSAEYNVYVIYNGKKYHFDNKAFFEAHEYDIRGQKIIMLWVTEYYDNDTTKSELKICDSN